MAALVNLHFGVPGCYCGPLGSFLPPEGFCDGTPSILEPAEKGGVLLGKGGVRVTVMGRVSGGKGNDEKDEDKR